MVDTAPTPPRVARGPLRYGAAIDFLRRPTEFVREQRSRHGDTFTLDVFGLNLFWVFSPTGLESLYALGEEDASFTEATRTLLGFKLPDALVSGDMRMFHQLFGKKRRAGYLAHIVDAIDLEIAALGDRGELETFTHMKRVVHRVGFRSWAGEEAASDRYLSRLIDLFERLDPEAAFVRPASLLGTLVSRKRGENRALREIQRILTEIWEARREPRGDMLEELHALYDDRALEDRHAAVARDVVVLHLASLSNLYAAMAWTLINLLQRPKLLARHEAEVEAVRREHGDAYLSNEAAIRELTTLEQCARESIRFAQQSITLRKVMRPVEVDDGEHRYRLEPGTFVATLLSATNCQHGTLREFDADHYSRGRLTCPVPKKEVVSTFGHGRHSCPGQRFAIAAIKVAVCRHLDALSLEPRFAKARISPSQIGAVGRADAPCPMGFRRRGVARAPRPSSAARSS